MKGIITGKGSSGSFQIRGVQLGAAMGMDVMPMANSLKGYDFAIVVKRCPPDLLHRIRTRGIPLVWDAVDAWPQPEGNTWDEVAAKRWLDVQLDKLNPVAVVAATEAMEKDIKGRGRNIPTLALPHHARPGQMINPIRPVVKKVGYEGSLPHLGKWANFLTAECKKRDAEFVINPRHLADLDIVVALRELNGYPAMQYKSNVKLANAQGSGTPIILAKESGYIEQASGGEIWVNSEKDFIQSLDYLWPQERRLAARSLLRSKDVSIETIVEKYSKWLNQIRF